MNILAVRVALLCLALCGSGEAGFFDGCVHEDSTARNQNSCVFVPKVWLKSETYVNLAHLALTNSTLPPDGDYLNTVFEVTRAANQVRTKLRSGIMTKLEFSTVESFCTRWQVYSKEACLPRKSTVNGICQARFHYIKSLKLEDIMCEPGLQPNFDRLWY